MSIYVTIKRFSEMENRVAVTRGHLAALAVGLHTCSLAGLKQYSSEMTSGTQGNSCDVQCINFAAFILFKYG